MVERILIRRGTYHDSAFLMKISRELCRLVGVQEAVVLMGTEMNLELLEQAGFHPQELSSVSPMDLVLALRVDRDEQVAAADQELTRLLQGEQQGIQETTFGSLSEALSGLPKTKLVSIAVPGVYAAFPAYQALHQGKHVFLFSNNVSLDDEISLKKQALSQDLLLMGPDCGTAILQGVGLGFTNRVEPGPVGIVGASGTGIQELCCGLSRLGVGVSHAIGTGSRDLSLEVNGAMTEFGLRALQSDPHTEVIVLVAKHPADSVARRIHGLLLSLDKPSVVRYLGQSPPEWSGSVHYAQTLDEATAVAVARLEDRTATPTVKLQSGAADNDPGTESAPVRGRLIGLFGGGSLAAEAHYLIHRFAGLDLIVPDKPLPPEPPLSPDGHLIVDTGEDFYTIGRPHPMVDQTVRCNLLRASISDPTVGLVLFDLVLGDGAHPDPAPELAKAIEEGQKARSDDAACLVASVSGTNLDPQDRNRQMESLKAAGVWVRPSATQAAVLAAKLVIPRRLGEEVA